MDLENVDAAPSETRLYINRIIEISEFHIIGKPGGRCPDAMPFTEQESLVFIVARDTGRFAGYRNRDPQLRESTDSAAEDRQFIIDCGNDKRHLFRIADAFENWYVIAICG